MGNDLQLDEYKTVVVGLAHPTARLECYNVLLIQSVRIVNFYLSTATKLQQALEKLNNSKASFWSDLVVWLSESTDPTGEFDRNQIRMRIFDTL